ncbi:hypothetical protein [Lutimonas halocynthiae]|uniref:hypothetical protein n=1 Tax=Lutimonas halocynthiae TaxID=1446477 RepID=UPI0025B53316|nr:hypothetical protein [Lutimonas halocynthiae]
MAEEFLSLLEQHSHIILENYQLNESCSEELDSNITGVPLKICLLKQLGILNLLKGNFNNCNQTKFSLLVSVLIGENQEAVRKCINELYSGNEHSRNYPCKTDYHVPIIKNFLQKFE